MRPRSRSFLLATIFAASLATVAPAETGEGVPWRDLFDGESLAGWVQRNGKAKYTVEDGCIVGSTVRGSANSFLCTRQCYGDFVLELEYLVDPALNSGVQIRSESYPEYRGGRVHGYQVEIDPSARAWSGGIYDEARRGWLRNLKENEKARKAFRQGEWNHYRIEAVGDSIRTWINSVPAADLEDSMTRSGFIALQVHANRSEKPLQIRWRKIRIRDLDRPSRPLKALIVDGHNNHAWKKTTPVLVEILEATGLFKVEVATVKEPADFHPDWKSHDVIVSNYNGPAWPEATRAAFVDYMRAGGGLVVYHAADNSFPEWPEYNAMIGLGGWGRRNESAGPYVYYRDGKIVRDESPGRAGSHGPQHEFPVVVRNDAHPITAGLPAQWLHTADELYNRLRGPAQNMRILATAYSPPDKRGSGRDEPMLIALRFGKGRIFHTAMGHGVSQTRGAGFVATFQRGTEWAATGKVSQKSVPADFPAADRTSSWSGPPKR